jgi:hypothetical protein
MSSIASKSTTSSKVQQLADDLPDELLDQDGTVAEQVEDQIALSMGYQEQLERIRDDELQLKHAMISRPDVEMLIETGLLERTNDSMIEWGRCADYALTDRAELLLDVLAE